MDIIYLVNDGSVVFVASADGEFPYDQRRENEPFRDNGWFVSASHAG